jgi:hypothetical protein
MISHIGSDGENNVELRAQGTLVEGRAGSGNIVFWPVVFSNGPRPLAFK